MIAALRSTLAPVLKADGKPPNRVRAEGEGRTGMGSIRLPPARLLARCHLRQVDLWPPAYICSSRVFEQVLCGHNTECEFLL